MLELYVVREGVRHGAAGKYGPGAFVLLDPREAAGFPDKLREADVAELRDRVMAMSDEEVEALVKEWAGAYDDAKLRDFTRRFLSKVYDAVLDDVETEAEAGDWSTDEDVEAVTETLLPDDESEPAAEISVSALVDAGLQPWVIEKLIDAGYTWLYQIDKAGDDELTAIAGIGDATVAAIREAVDEAHG